ncbi:MAG: hypothetical protein M0R33_19005 [Methylomonas sp.]|jgi:hypothetical protein|uniref:hypothetical protein n=1 Tax=Methylomonas sp. TaxID=418 RepID=UPI0025F5755A|nr:hypothetical protein [Methylomonas sp.]MCK9608535.1 hypothetical protein [Methylomonas sp.]
MASTSSETLNILCVDGGYTNNDYVYLVICHLNRDEFSAEVITKVLINEKILSAKRFAFANDALYIFENKSLVDLDVRPKCIAKIVRDGTWKIKRDPIIDEQEERDLKLVEFNCNLGPKSTLTFPKLNWNGLQCEIASSFGNAIRIKTINPKTAKVEKYALPESLSHVIFMFTS